MSSDLNSVDEVGEESLDCGALEDDDPADCFTCGDAVCIKRAVSSGSAVSMKRRVGKPSPSATNSSNNARCRFVSDLQGAVDISFM